MKPREYAEHLRGRGYSYEKIRLLVSLTFGKPVHYKTILSWLSPYRQASQRRYMRKWQRQHVADQKPKGEPITDRERFNIKRPFDTSDPLT